MTPKGRAYVVVALWLGPLIAPATSQVIRIDPPPQGSGFGAPVVGLPDVDGDGVGDFAIGAGGATTQGDPRVGRVFIFSGRTRQPIRALESPLPRSGFSFGGALDFLPLAGGTPGIVVGEVAGTLNSVGCAHVFSAATGDWIRTVSSGLPSPGVNYGWDVATVPDVNADGVPDFAVAAPHDSPPSNSGRVYVYSGATGALLRTLSSPQALVGSNFGLLLAGAPDMNGDGRGDLLISAHEAPLPGQPATGVTYVIVSGGTGETGMRLPYIGVSSSVPDVDGDGVPDVAIGNWDVQQGTGILWVISGATGQLLYSLQSPTAPAVASQFGSWVCGIADIDGDGRGDILIGAVTEAREGYEVPPGAAYLISGATGRILRRFDSTAPPQPQWGSPLFFGAYVTMVPDSNADGIPEVAASSVNDPGGGRVYLFLSCAPDWNFSGTVDSADFFDFLTSFFADVADFNHDGLTNSQDFFDFLTAFFVGCP